MKLTDMPGEKTGDSLGLMTRETVADARRYHASFPQYAPTPLRDLRHLAEAFGVRRFFVKDESFRFGLNAFKVLGSSYAMGRYLARKAGLSASETTYERLTSKAFHDVCGDITFITATDGNHGRGVAWTAHALGQHSVVYMPKGSRPERLENIRAAGAEASITELKYDDVVRMASKQAKENGWVLVQDTAWLGYEEIPGWIITGYGTMATEIVEELPEPPTHVFLQAGVGSMAAGVAAVLKNAYPEHPPTIIIVEPTAADCFYRSAAAKDGKRHFAVGDMKTIMAGLACGEPCTLAWDILMHTSDFALACEDDTAADAMRILGAPLGDDPRIISGESGASGAGAALALLGRPENQALAAKLGLGKDASILCISTEGATDRERYREITWHGAFPAPDVGQK